MVQGDLEDRDSLAAAMRGPRPPGSTRRVVVFFISTPCLASGGYAVDAEKEYAQSGQDFFECDIQSLRCVT